MHRYFRSLFRRHHLLITTVTFLFCLNSHAQDEHPEVRRTQGFRSYKNQKKLLETERDKGLSLYLEQVEMDKREYDQALKVYRKEKSKQKPLEQTSAYQEQLSDRHGEQRQREQDLEDYRAGQRVEKRQLQQAHLNPMEELNLPEDRPRYDVKKRVLYGATSHFGKPGASSSAGSGGALAPTFPDSGNSFTPPPSNFDDFPPAAFPDDNFDLPPPPPPPPMPFDDGTGFNNAPFDDFPPPPPPSDDFQF